jgi:hypothetical protein
MLNIWPLAQVFKPMNSYLFETNLRRHSFNCELRLFVKRHSAMQKNLNSS